ncbi:hypothetical protein ALFP_1517 [Alcaligenes faecalis]|nr:hypothetical protein ALFP_1517 [Alcaligenes faecalis]
MLITQQSRIDIVNRFTLCALNCIAPFFQGQTIISKTWKRKKAEN